MAAKKKEIKVSLPTEPRELASRRPPENPDMPQRKLFKDISTHSGSATRNAC